MRRAAAARERLGGRENGAGTRVPAPLFWYGVPPGFAGPRRRRLRMSLRDYFEERSKDWGSLYDRAADLGSYNFQTRREAVLRLLAADGPFARVLDVGCGTGDYVGVAARHGGAYFGLDFAPGMIRAARERTADAGHPVHLAVGAGERLPYRDDAFDLVLALGYIAYFADPRPALGEIRRVLRPGGSLVLQCSKADLFGTIDRALLNPLLSLLRDGRLHRPVLPDGWVNVRYSERRLDDLAREAGFERTGRAFNNFNVLPAILRRRHPGRAIRWSEALTRGRPDRWRFLAVNYIARYVLP